MYSEGDRLLFKTQGGRKMKELIEKLKKYNAWRRGDETVPQPHPQEVGEREAND